jgi:hypothetical protein
LIAERDELYGAREENENTKRIISLYLQCLDEDFGKTPIPSFCYTFSMDARKEAAQATIDFFVKPKVKSPSKNSRGP